MEILLTPKRQFCHISLGLITKLVQMVARCTSCSLRTSVIKEVENVKIGIDFSLMIFGKYASTNNLSKGIV